MRMARLLIGLIFIGLGVTAIVGTSISVSAGWFAAAGAAAVGLALIGTAWDRRELGSVAAHLDQAID